MYSIIPLSQSILTTVTVVGSITPSQLPIFVGSGPLHNVGAVPDPGAIAGINRYLCESGIWAVPPGVDGTVSSVGLTMPPGVFTTAGPVTSTGSLTASFVTQNTNTIFSGPATGGPTVPSFRALVSTDIPSLDAAKITTGILPVTQGGTGAATLAGVRTSIGAAAIGVNSDITSLTTATSLTSPSGLTLSSSGGNNISLMPVAGGICQVIGASTVSNVLRLRGGVVANNTTAMFFYGANLGADVWSIGNAISTADTARAFEIYDVPNSLTRLRILNTGAVVIPTGDLQIPTVSDLQSRTVSCRSYAYATNNKEVSLTYYGSAVAGNIFGAVPLGGLGVLTFRETSNGAVYTTAVAPLIFGTGSVERMRISGTGQVGIGVTNPTNALEVAGNIKIISPSTFIGDGSQITGLTASQIPAIDASKITSGTISSARLPTIDAATISTGTLSTSQIPNLDATKITSGTLPIVRGGTGGASQLAALNNVLPSQSGQTGKMLQTDGTNANWAIAGGSVTSFSAGQCLPLFKTGVTTSTTTPSLTFSLEGAPANSWFGNTTSVDSNAPTHNTTPIPSSLIPANIRLGVTTLSGPNIDWSVSSAFIANLGSNLTFTFTNATPGQTIRVKITQSIGTGPGTGWTVTWPSQILWPGGTEPVMTAVSGKVDLYIIYYDGASYIGYYVQNCS